MCVLSTLVGVKEFQRKRPEVPVSIRLERKAELREQGKTTSRRIEQAVHQPEAREKRSPAPLPRTLAAVSIIKNHPLQ